MERAGGPSKACLAGPIADQIKCRKKHTPGAPRPGAPTNDSTPGRRTAPRASIADLHALDAPGVAVPDALIAPEAARAGTVIDRGRRVIGAGAIAVIGAVRLRTGAADQCAANQTGDDAGTDIASPARRVGLARRRECGARNGCRRGERDKGLLHCLLHKRDAQNGTVRLALGFNYWSERGLNTLVRMRPC